MDEGDVYRGRTPPCDIQPPLIIILRIGGLFPGMFKVVSALGSRHSGPNFWRERGGGWL